MKNCEFCKIEFIPKKPKGRFCGRVCACRFVCHTYVGAIWTKKEDDFLLEQIGQTPAKNIVKAYKLWSSESRTTDAILGRLDVLASRENISLDCVDDNFSMSAAAKFLGVSRWIICKLVANKQLKTRKVAWNQSAILKADLKKAVLRNPSDFKNCDRDNLFWVLGKQELVDRVKDAPAKRQSAIQITDGINIYPSVRQAAKQNFCSKTLILKALETNAIVNNKRFYKV